MKITLTGAAKLMQQQLVMESIARGEDIRPSQKNSKVDISSPKNEQLGHSSSMNKIAATRAPNSGGFLNSANRNASFLPPIKSTQLRLPNSKDVFLGRTTREVAVKVPKVSISKYFRVKYASPEDPTPRDSFTERRVFSPLSNSGSPQLDTNTNTNSRSTNPQKLDCEKLYELNDYNTGFGALNNPEEYVMKSISLRNLQKTAQHDEIALQKLELKLKKLIDKHNMEIKRQTNLSTHIREKQSKLGSERKEPWEYPEDEVFRSTKAFERTKIRVHSEQLKRYNKIWKNKQVGRLSKPKFKKLKFDEIKLLYPEHFGGKKEKKRY